MVTAPPIRRRLVGRELRRYRESLGLTLEDAARTLECDRSKISRIETGERGIRGKELRELLDDYGVADDEQALLMLLADRHGASGWPQDYAGVLPGAPNGLVKGCGVVRPLGVIAAMHWPKVGEVAMLLTKHFEPASVSSL